MSIEEAIQKAEIIFDNGDDQKFEPSAVLPEAILEAGVEVSIEGIEVAIDTSSSHLSEHQTVLNADQGNKDSTTSIPDVTLTTSKSTEDNNEIASKAGISNSCVSGDEVQIVGSSDKESDDVAYSFCEITPKVAKSLYDLSQDLSNNHEVDSALSTGRSISMEGVSSNVDSKSDVSVGSVCQNQNDNVECNDNQESCKDKDSNTEHFEKRADEDFVEGNLDIQQDESAAQSSALQSEETIFMNDEVDSQKKPVHTVIVAQNHHNLRPKRTHSLRHVHALKQQAKRRKRNTSIAAGGMSTGSTYPRPSRGLPVKSISSTVPCKTVKMTTSALDSSPVFCEADKPTKVESCQGKKKSVTASINSSASLQSLHPSLSILPLTIPIHRTPTRKQSLLNSGGIY